MRTGAHRRVARLALHELVELAVDVEVVEEKRGPWSQYARHLADDLQVLLLGGEVAEAREEVHQRRRSAVAERQLAHVGARQRHRPVLADAGAQQGEGEVAADGPIAEGLQLLHVPPHAAGEIEDRAVERAELLDEKTPPAAAPPPRRDAT